MSKLRGGFSPVSLLSLVAFFSSMPLLLAPLDLIRSFFAASGFEALLRPLLEAPFLVALALAAMFTSLAMLFVCLLKTAYARLNNRLLMAAGAAYLIGMLLLCSATVAPAIPSQLIVIAGGLLGVGGAVLCMAWARQVHLVDYRRALGSLLALGASVFVVDIGLSLLSPVPRMIVFMVLACLGTIGCVASALAANRTQAQATTSGSNWWDVFGRFDMSLLEGGGDFATPLSRILFFIVTPAIVFLLFVVGMNLHHTMYGDFPVELVGGLLAIVCAVPILFIKGERVAINAAYRFYLPIIAVIVFVAGDFAPTEIRGLLLNVGVYIFCFVYGLLMCAMIITMMSRMKSLSLPAACMLVIAVSFIAIISYMNIDAGELEAFRLIALLVLLLIAGILLAAMPTSRVWRVVIEGIEGSDRVTDVSGKSHTTTLEDRSDQLASACGLTPRESEILRYLGRGYGSVYIADELVIAESTVRSHVKSIYRKLDVSSREELIMRIDEIGETL